MTDTPAQRPARLRAWIIWSLSALAFGYAFFQRVAPSVMVPDLMREFQAGGAVLGYLSALYFYPYVFLQVPLGALLDRLGPRLLLTFSLSIAAAGSVLFATAPDITLAYTGRFLVGIGVAAGFIGSLALAAAWFPPHRFAFLAGLAMFFAMLCGVAAQAPLALVVEHAGWRTTMLVASGFCAVLAVLIYAIVRDAPSGGDAHNAKELQSWPSIWRNLKIALARWNVWMISAVAMSMTGGMLAFGGLWGVPYLMAAYELDRPTAAFIASLVLLGWAAGAPLAGWASDAIGLRKTPIAGCCLAQTCLTAMLVLAPNLPLSVLSVLLFALGMTGAGMVNCFALAREVTQPAIHGSVTGIVNGMTVMSGAVLQPVIGLLLDWQWDGTMLDGARVYTSADYGWAFISLLVWSVAGLVIALFLTETHCKPLPEVQG